MVMGIVALGSFGVPNDCMVSHVEEELHVASVGEDVREGATGIGLSGKSVAEVGVVEAKGALRLSVVHLVVEESPVVELVVAPEFGQAENFFEASSHPRQVHNLKTHHLTTL